MVIHPQQPVLPTTMSDAKPSLKIFEGTSLDNGPSKTTPMMSLRYGRSKKHVLNEASFDLRSILDFEETPSYTPNWTKYIHPEGAVYYYDACRRLTTDANLQNQRILNLVDDFISQLFRFMETLAFTLHDSQEVIIELNDEEDGCYYYLVDHQKRTIFFPDAVSTEELQFPRVVSRDHLLLELNRQYWVYFEYFPMHRVLNASARLELLGILSHAYADNLTSNSSTAPRSAEECKNFRDLLEKFKGEPESRGYENCVIARLQHEFIQGRFLNYYGEANGARLSRTEYIDDGSEIEEETTSFFFSLCSLLLFRLPEQELEQLKSLSVNSTFYSQTWQKFNVTHVSGWQRLTTTSLLLMIVDIVKTFHFQNFTIKLDQTSGIMSQIGWHTGAMSAILCLGSLALSLTAIQVHQPHCTTGSVEAGSYFLNAKHEKYGLRPLAIALALPYSLLLWALAGTCISFVTLSLRTIDIWNASLLGSILLLLIFFVSWGILFFHFGNSGFNSFIPSSSFPSFGRVSHPLSSPPSSTSHVV